ncbi:MAG TPA: OmpA family protein [Kofleriaceae bacterium]|jgi:peptidoglycan-associated lipoprotein|nr:OmpA family protein [Kofleriaceae bacterium]
MRTSRRHAVVLALGALVAVAACKKTPVKQPAPAPAPPPQQSTRPAPTGGDAGIALTGPDADQAPPSGPIFFEFDSATLTMSSRELLATLANWLEKHPCRLRIEGHTDERGTTEYNLALGDRRARAIADYLAAMGIDPATLTTVTYGEEQPVYTGHDERAWAHNRRGELRARDQAAASARASADDEPRHDPRTE